MALTKLTDNLNSIQSLPNKPSLEAEELKAEFDKSGNLIKAYINEILTEEIEALITNTVESAKVIVENVLTSSSSVNALSANQGKELKDLIDTMKTKLDGIATGANKTTVENVLTSTSTTNALSAYQGNVLKSQIDAKQKTITKGTATPSGGSSGDIYIQYF